jgi:hypothetical protein
MTLFVVLGLVAVVVGVLVAVALGVRSMRADGRDESGYWDSPDADSDLADLDDLDDDIPVQRSRGKRRRSGPGSQHADALSSPPSSRGYGGDPVLGAAADAARAAGRPARAALAAGSAGTGSPGRRRPQAQDEPRRQSRPPRSRRTDADGWNDTNWERVSDEDYWAELSADKPLASRTAQSAADLRSPEPEKPPRREQHTDPDLMRPEPQTATMAMPEYGTGVSPLVGNAAATDAPATLPVRRSGNATDPGGFPSVGGITGHVPADYSDPNLAALASLGGQAVDSAPLSAPTAGMTAQAPVDPLQAPAAGGWTAGGPGQGDWSYGGQDRSLTGGHAAPAQVQGSQSYGVDGSSAYARGTPGYGFPAGPGYGVAGQPDAGLSAASAPAHAAPPDQSAGRYDGHANMNGSHGSQYGTGSYPSGSYGADTGSYGTSSYGQPSYGTSNGSYTPPHGADSGSYTSPYGGTDGGSYAAPPAYGTYGATSSYGATSRHSREAAWEQTSQAAGGGYQAPAPSGVYASGYLSSSALSAHREPAEPEQLIGSGSGNPYGSYVTGPASPPDEATGGIGSYVRPAQNGDLGYRDQQPYGGYGEFNGGAHRR